MGCLIQQPKSTALPEEDSTPQSVPPPLQSALPTVVYNTNINVVKPGATAAFHQASKLQDLNGFLYCTFTADFH